MGKFGGFGGGNMQALMRQAQKMQEDMVKAQEELKSTEFTGSAGGMVDVTMTGDKTVVAIKIKPEAVDPQDVEMLEDLIVAAINDATSKVVEESERAMGPYASMLGGMGL